MGRTPRRGVEGAQPPQNKNKMIVGHHPGRGVEGGTPSEEKKEKKKKIMYVVAHVLFPRKFLSAGGLESLLPSP